MFTVIEKSSRGIALKNNEKLMIVKPVTRDIVRVICTTRDSAVYKKGLIRDEELQCCSYDVEETEENIVIKTETRQIVLTRRSGEITYKKTDGQIMSVQNPFKGIEEFDVYKTVFDDKKESIKSADGDRVQTKEKGKVLSKKLYRARVEFEFDDNEAIFGFGSHEEGFGNLRGKHRELYQHNMKISIPCFSSTKGYGCIFNAGCYMEFHDDEDGSYVWLDGAEEIDYFTVMGDSFSQVLSGFRTVTGETPMLPEYAFGYWQSRERYKSAEELISTVEEYRKRDVPLDIIVLDWMSWPNNMWGQKTLDAKRFENPKKMMEKLHSLGARLMVSIWPNPCIGSSDQIEFSENGCLLGDESTYDAFSEKGRKIYWQQVQRGFFDHGVDAWWCDSSEPFISDWKGKVKLPPAQRIKENTELLRRYIDYDRMNEYSLYHSKGIYEGQRGCSEVRVLNLTRSAIVGQHRYGTVVWSGDVTATWETLKRQIPEGVNYTATGEAYWSVDIGGFFVKSEDRWFWRGDYQKGTEDYGYRELYVRWLQYATFLPIMRSHGTDTFREIWNFGEKGDMFYDAIEKFIKLRYSLLPYIYSLAGKVMLEGDAIMRPLAMEFPDDKNTHSMDYQYMFGPSVMVAPVCRPMYYEKNCRKTDEDFYTKVYLPEGSGWYDFWSNDFTDGGQTISKEYPIDVMPLFVKEGSIIPMTNARSNTVETIGEPYSIYVYTGRDASFVIYEDEGNNYNYEKGCFSLTELQWNEEDRVLTISERKGNFEGCLRKREYRIILIDKTGTREHTVTYNSERIAISFKGISEK